MAILSADTHVHTQLCHVLTGVTVGYMYDDSCRAGPPVLLPPPGRAVPEGPLSLVALQSHST